jgi:phenylpropionate dioxygenase-like ring-hydroxylating dioxygenase large terminal subunit
MDGSLIGVPVRSGYPDFGSRRETLGLKRVPRVSTYRGFIFASLATTGPDLKTFLGPITSAFDDMVDRAPEGEVEVTGGVFRTVSRANWKIQVENSNDALHPHATHQSAIEACDAVTAPRQPTSLGAHDVDILKANGAPLKRMDQMGVFACEYGHSYLGSLPVPPKGGAGFDAYRARLNAVHGEGRATEILSVSRHQNVIYPNIVLNGAAGRIKIIEPVAVDRTESYAYAFRLKGAPEEMTHAAIRALNRANSPAALLFPDDLELWMRCQRAMAGTPGHEWLDFSMDAGREVAGNGGYVANGLSELTMRNAFQAWRRFMLEEA